MTTDASDRSRISTDLDTSMVVVAGAGTGKTTVLVERILGLVRSGRSRLREVAAITFTEAAAAELRERVRLRLDSALRERPGDRRLAEALEEVDEAAISTLHSFAQRILLEHCAAAGIPSNFEILDDTADERDFNRRFARFADVLMEDRTVEPALSKGFASGLRHTDLRTLAKALHENWDRLEDSDDVLLTGAAAGEIATRWPEVDSSFLIEEIGRATSMAHWCSEDEDKLLAHIREALTIARIEIEAADDDEEALLQALSNLAPLRCTLGRQENWDGHITEVREACSSAESERQRILDSVRRAVLFDLLPRIASFVLDAAEGRRADGTLNFHDLLVHARRLLRVGGEPVEELRRRYRWILIDEFQDTDPIQVELASRIVSGDGSGEDDGEDASLSSVRRGSLFVVGDPKQSIYRFRRADIELFEEVSSRIPERVFLRTNFRSVPGIIELVNVVFADLFGSQLLPGQARHDPLVAQRPVLGRPGKDLSSRRSRGFETKRQRKGRAVLAENQMSLPLAELDPEAPSPNETDPAITSGTSTTPFAPDRNGTAAAGAGTSTDAPVLLLGGASDGSASEVRRLAAKDVASSILLMVRDRWTVSDPESAEPRAAKFSDVAVLMPARTFLPSLEEALDEAQVPFRLEGASMLWASEDVRGVLAVLRAVDDPADQIAVLAALRSPGLACGDDDLLTWYLGGGAWDMRREIPPDLVGHPVARAMTVLDELHQARWWSEPSDLVQRAIDALRSYELAFAHRRPRDHWHRLEWLCDQARSFDEDRSGTGTLTAFLSWSDLQSEGYSGARGVGPPDPDDDAVRVMTIHGSKGLEFPITVVCGLERQDFEGHQPSPVLWDDTGRLHVRAGPQFRTEGYDEADQRDRDLDVLERSRLLYVAMTRARDHLVLCVHHRARSGGGDSSLAAQLSEICERRPDLWYRPGDEELITVTPVKLISIEEEPPPAAEVTPDAVQWSAFCAEWERERFSLLERLRRRPVVSATALSHQGRPKGASAPGDAPEADGETDDPTVADPGGRRSVALQIGRAVHGALSVVEMSEYDEDPGPRLEELARSWSITHGVGTHASTVASLVRSALDSPIVRRATLRRNWRELYVAAPLVSTADDEFPATLEGYIDLVFEDDDGSLVIVDYKTDVVSDSELAHAVSVYGTQVAAYAEALETSTGRSVSKCVLLFVSRTPALSYAIESEELQRARAAALSAATIALGSP